GALYNPWTGPQTREKLLDVIAGNDDLQPLESFETTNGGASEAAADAVEAACGRDVLGREQHGACLGGRDGSPRRAREPVLAQHVGASLGERDVVCAT